jgi:hypothetical protein
VDIQVNSPLLEWSTAICFHLSLCSPLYFVIFSQLLEDATIGSFPFSPHNFWGFNGMYIHLFLLLSFVHVQPMGRNCKEIHHIQLKEREK